MGDGKRSYAVATTVVVLAWLTIIVAVGHWSLAETNIASPAVARACSDVADGRTCLELTARFSEIRSRARNEFAAIALGGILVILGTFVVLAGVLRRNESDRRVPPDYAALVPVVLGSVLVAVALFSRG